MQHGRVTPAAVDDLERRGRRLPLAGFRVGYRVDDVDRFIRDTLAGLRASIEANDALRSGIDPATLWTADRAWVAPLDVQGVVFGVAKLRRGYRMRPVDELLDDITDAMNVVLAEGEALRSRRS